eukprot:737873-Pleurochrysis_carterae.AAC.2
MVSLLDSFLRVRRPQAKQNAKVTTQPLAFRPLQVIRHFRIPQSAERAAGRARHRSTACSKATSSNAHATHTSLCIQPAEAMARPKAAVKSAVASVDDAEVNV